MAKRVKITFNISNYLVTDMDSSMIFLLAADVVMLLHALFVAFVVIGLVLVLIGKACDWNWLETHGFA